MVGKPLCSANSEFTIAFCIDTFSNTQDSWEISLTWKTQASKEPETVHVKKDLTVCVCICVCVCHSAYRGRYFNHETETRCHMFKKRRTKICWMLKYNKIISKKVWKIKWETCQEGKVKSREMEPGGETRQLVSIQSEKVLEVKNRENQMGSKHKSQSGIPMPWIWIEIKSHSESSKTVR